MLFIKLSFSEAKALNERVTTDCIAQGKWSDSITNNYCHPFFDEETQMWLVPVLEGYESFFTDQELENAYH
jgi:hypothetical protein